MYEASPNTHTTRPIDMLEGKLGKKKSANVRGQHDKNECMRSHATDHARNQRI